MSRVEIVSIRRHWDSEKGTGADGEAYPLSSTPRTVERDDLERIDLSDYWDVILDVFPDKIKNIHASKRKQTIKRVLQWYLVHRKVLQSPPESRRSAEGRVAEEQDVTRQSVQRHVQELYSGFDIASPTQRFGSDLERIWEQVKKDVYQYDSGLQDACLRLRSVLRELVARNPPQITSEEITCGDAIAAEEANLASPPGVDLSQYDSESPIPIREGGFFKPKDITLYDCDFGQVWQHTLDSINEYLTRWGKKDDAVEVTSDWDCTEAYAVSPYEKDPEPDVFLDINYYACGVMKIEARVWPDCLIEDEVTRLCGTASSITEDQIDCFIAEALRVAELVERDELEATTPCWLGESDSPDSQITES